MSLKLRVGFLSTQPRGGLGQSIRVWEIIDNLAELGIEVHVFTAFKDDAKNDLEGLHIHHIPSILSKLGIEKMAYTTGNKIIKTKFGSSLFFRKTLLTNVCWQFSRQVLQYIRKQQIDILQGEQEIASLACTFLRNELKIPIVSDLHGLLPEELVLSGCIKPNSSPWIGTVSIVEKILSSSNVTTVVSEEMKRYLKENYSNNSTSKIEIIPNASSPRERVRRPNMKPRRLVYAGNLDYWENLELLIKSMTYLKNSDLEVYIIGSGRLEAQLKSLAASMNVSPIFWSRIHRIRLFNFLTTCDVGLVPSTNDITRQVASPIKLFDYLSIGLPVVTVKVGGWSKIVDGNHVGIVTELDPRNFAEGILTLLDDPDELNECGQRALELIRDKYNWKDIAKKLIKIYENTVLFHEDS